MKKGYVTILDIENDKTHIYQIFLSDDTSLEDRLISMGFDLKRIHYMFTDIIKLEIH